ncbi:MAG TPA: DNA polymerase/3'-5' exonuclease PolX, partial [Candidatus Polarisedimenticolia bacterium]|nr:DNA polymerase/3'-5' exonuclease PolX [Candidatus Polarisedimenticolia bacterium]
GPKRVKTLYEKLDVRTFEDLAKALRDGRVHDLPGFGETLEKKILQAVEKRTEAPRRTPLPMAEPIAERLLADLEKAQGLGQAVIAGSYRRRSDTIGDLDILATGKDSGPIMDRFVRHEEVGEIVSEGPTRSTIRLKAGLQVDLRVVPEESFGAALHYFTGSKAHNIAVRGRGVERGLKINEYGVFKDEKRIAGRTEQEVYRTVGLPYIPPELREDRGEIQAAGKGRLPRLVTLKEIRGDLHSHTDATDGRFPLEEMARAARDRGYEYLAITDHTWSLTVARGQDPKRIRAQMKAIDRLNADVAREGGARPFRILKSAEVDILEDGSLDLPDDVLKELDLTVCSVHSKFDLPRAKQTERIIRAMDDRYFTILGHPTGRLIPRREPYEVDLERVVEAARERGCYLEVNAQPERLDLMDVHCLMAKEAGVKVAISTDSHSIASLDAMRFGIDQARRGWLTPDDVLNTRSWTALSKLVRRA